MSIRNGSILSVFCFLFSSLASAQSLPFVEEILRKVDCNAKCATSCSLQFQVDRNLQNYLGCTGGCRSACENRIAYGDDGMHPPVDVAPEVPYGDDGLNPSFPVSGSPLPGPEAPPTLGLGEPEVPPVAPPAGGAVCTAIAWWDPSKQQWVGGCNQ